jgi:hypothetical protein
MTLRHIISGTYCDRNQRPCPTDDRGKLRCDCVIDDEDAAIEQAEKRADSYFIGYAEP